MIEQRFRDQYDGEHVVVDTVWRRGRKLQSKEFLKNPIVNQHISGRAVVIGEDETVRADVVKLLENHKGGLLGQKKLQTYGCEGVWKKIRLDFCVESNTEELRAMVEQDYVTNTAVYSTIRNCLAFPGKFYTVPYGVRLQPAAQAAYIAAFDGHKEIFLVGIDGINPHTVYDTQIYKDLLQVFQVYTTTKFYLVTDGAKPNDEWRSCPNVEVWPYQKFIIHCDV